MAGRLGEQMNDWGELKIKQWSLRRGHKGVKPWKRSKQTERIRGGYVELCSWTTGLHERAVWVEK